MTNLKTRRELAALELGAATLLALGRIANANECAPDKVRLDGSGQKAGATMPKDVTDAVIASIPLVEETEVGVKDRLLRLRRLEIKPGGEVPWHSHADRPAIIYIVKGSITEYRRTLAKIHLSITRVMRFPRTTSFHTGGRTPATRRQWCYQPIYST